MLSQHIIRLGANVNLSRAERWMLWNQLRTLEALYPEEASDYAKGREVLEHGFEGHYGWLVDSLIYEDTLSEAACAEVFDILSVYETLKRSYETLSDKSGIEERDIQFPGFDGNDRTEVKYMAYTQFLVHKDGRYSTLHRGDNFNSHMRLLPAYRRQVSKWKELGKKYMDLTKSEIEAIVQERRPQN